MRAASERRAVDAEPVAFGVDPVAQPRPGGDEGLVGEFHGAVVEGEQPGRDQPVQDGAGAVGVAEVEFRVLGGAPGVGVPSPGATSRSRIRRARSAWARVSSPYTSSAVRTTAPRSPPAAS